MAQTIQIKRSTGSSAPSSLANGELAYLHHGNNKKLYIGNPGGASGDISVIGGKDFTDKLDGIEAGATADQTNAEIRAAVEAATDSNVFTDADHTKLEGIEAGADVTDATNVANAGAVMTTGGSLTSHLSFGDDVEAKFGASGDLKIFHGTDDVNSVNIEASYIKEDGTGNLILQGSNIEVRSSTDELYAQFVQDGVVQLSCDNVVKLSTTAAGINVIGEVKGDSLDIDGSADISTNLTIGGNLTVNGTTTTVNSTAVTIDDPLFTLGGDAAPSTDDNLDRGIEFRWHNSSAAKLGFFGFDDSTGEFTFIPDATNTSNVMSGTKGTANFGTLKLDTDLAVTYGGTGRSSFTTNGIAYGNGSSAMGVTAAGVWDSTHSVGQLLSVNSSGVPTWTNTIDGGTFS
jgi:hypothetical protein